MQCTVLPHIAISVFSNDDGPMAGCTTAPVELASGKTCPGRRDNADAHLKRHGPPSEAVVAMTTGRPDFDTWDQATFSACQRGSLRLAFWAFTDRWR